MAIHPILPRKLPSFPKISQINAAIRFGAEPIAFQARLHPGGSAILVPDVLPLK